jgi:hypothetical protein
VRHAGSAGGAYDVRARADTWLADDRLRDDQILLADDGAPGERLGDCWLAPAPLHRIVEDGNVLNAITWGPGLPELEELLARKRTKR